jgi:hypothetical protein
MRNLSVADPFLIIGAAVVKASLKMWLGKGNIVIAETSASVIDVIRAKISGDLEQRQAQRFFEDLEVPVAKRLRNLRQTEFGSMPENEWTAAVLAAGDSFNRARLTAQDLFTRDLDPLFLERHIRTDARAATRDLSADGTELYDRLITEGCAYVIEIADKLPHFSAGAFAELLRRESKILQIVSEVLDKIPDKAEGETQAARFTTGYLRHMATKLDRLELFGLDFESPWYPLSLAYVSLRVDAQDDSDSRDHLDEVQKRNIEDRLAAAHRTLVLGRAGSGKTTILQWIAVRAARSDFTGVLTYLNGCIPFFVKLREYVNNPLPEPEDFVTSMAPMLAGEIPLGWVRSQLRTSRALLLIDGVDELPASDREKVLKWLEDLIELFPQAHYIITARPSAVSADWLADLGFARTSLEAMPPSLVAAFVQHWHDAARGRLADDDADERIRLAEYERSLLATVYNDRYLRDLADTPLLAGLLCALNRHLRSRLPRRRSEIYAKALTMFDQRDRARNIGSGDIVLDLAAKTRLLADIALWMLRNGESEIDGKIALGLIHRSLSSMPGISHQPAVVFRILLERSALLREPASGQVDFVHRTFQEYLAAWAAVDGDVIGELIRNAYDDQWREVLVMAAGQSNLPQTNRLMEGLLTSAVKGSRRKRGLIAVACLEEVRSLDSKWQHAIEEKIPSLLPPESMDEAEQLSKAGERLIPLLTQYASKTRLRRDFRPWIIRAASLVGGPEALDLIGNVATNLSVRSMQTEVLRAWQYFNPDEYERRVLKHMNLDSIFVDDFPRIIQAISRLESLSEILVNPFNDMVDLDPLAGLPNLSHLGLAEVSAAQLQGLASCRQITRLTLPRFIGRDLSALEVPPNLEYLDIGAAELVSLTGIELWSSLVHLDLNGCPRLQDVQSLENLPKLKTLTIYNCPSLDRLGIPATVEVRVKA